MSKEEIDWDNIGSLVIPPIRSPEKFMEFPVLSRVKIEEMPIDPYDREYAYLPKTVWAGRIYCFDKEPIVFRYDLKMISEYRNLSDYDAAVRIAEMACILNITRDELRALEYERGHVSLFDVNRLASGSPSKEHLKKILKLSMQETSLTDEQLNQIINAYQYKGPCIEKYVKKSDSAKNAHYVFVVLKEGADPNEGFNFLTSPEKYAGFVSGDKYYPNPHIFEAKQWNLNEQTRTVDDTIEFFKGVRNLKTYQHRISAICTEIVGNYKINYISEKEIKKHITDEPLPREECEFKIQCNIRSAFEEMYTREQIQKITDYIIDRVFENHMLPERHDEWFYDSNSKTNKIC